MRPPPTRLPKPPFWDLSYSLRSSDFIAAMAPTEARILSNFLLTPAQLTAVISLEEFTSLFPRALQTSPQIRSLYRDLQSQRNALIDSIAEDIAAETKRGKAMRRAAIKVQQEAEFQDYDDEIEIERMVRGSLHSLFDMVLRDQFTDVKQLFGPASRTQTSKHTLNSIIPDLEKAIRDLESELGDLENEETNVLASVQQTVGNLSDLRYGRLGNNKLPEQVLEGLENLQETCKGDR